MDTIIGMVRRQRDLDFAPGEEHSYCNTGYNLLAAIVAKVTKQSFRRWTDENLFQPLGMMHTHFSEDPTEVIPNRAAYYISAGKGELRQFISQLAAPGSSSLMTTTEDMGKWLINFGTARVGGAGAIQMMQQSGKLNSGKEVDYGFGLGLDNYHGMRRAYHTGSWGGDCAMAWLPEKRFGVAVFANAPDANPARIAFAVANIYLGFPEPAHQPQPLADKSAAKRDVPKPVSKAFAAYVGDYWSEELEVVYHIEVRNGELMMGNRFNGWSKLLPKSHDRFDTEPRPGVFVAPAVDFTRDPASKVNGMKLTGGRIRNLRFTRVSLVQAGAE